MSNMEVTSSTATSSKDIRKIRKPLVERKRRARINKSLDALHGLLLEAAGIKSIIQSRQTKLEKADILDLTVLHIQNLKKQTQCGCLATKVNNQNGVTTTPHAINNQNYVEKYSKKCAGISDRLLISLNARDQSRHILRDESDFSNVKGVENPQFSNSDRENSQFSSRCTNFVLENPQFSNSDRENSQFSNRSTNFVVENQQFSEERLENFREIPVSLRENYENIDPSSHRVASVRYNNCSPPLSKTTENCSKNTVFSYHNMGVVNSRENSENSGFRDVSVEKSSNLVATSRSFLENSGFRHDLGVKSFENEQNMLENSRTRGDSVEENSSLVVNRGSLSLFPVKLADGTLAFIVPRDEERRLFEQNKVTIDEKTIREAKSEGVSVCNDGRNNNRVPQNCQNVWRPWF